MAKATSEFDRAYAAALAQTGAIMRGSMTDAIWHDWFQPGDKGGGGDRPTSNPSSECGPDCVDSEPICHGAGTPDQFCEVTRRYCDRGE